ncbi:hypothetical protein GTP44_03925 [Duganella sp. FT50W]|uniref:Helix-turn-helix domain-containing protein n=1 Tax=Duganella lactea TaxID=2692173 RepID=A0A6L8MH85_9BURK|nr:hypothetical protein [Duganella lactea]MYM34915.1 hypothetical protein [Duganella lactea]MYM81106.1 hypothetical protein [Duganella lactea]
MTRRHALTDDQVRAARAAYKPGVRGAGYESVARQLGVAVSTVRDALTGRTAYPAAVSEVRQ